MEKTHTLVIGASIKPERYSNMAVSRLVQHNEPVHALGLRSGKIGEVSILTDFPELDDVHTISLYLNPTRQEQYYDYILGLKPERVIFNPGTENPAFEKKLSEYNIEPIQACTLVMLSTGQF